MEMTFPPPRFMPTPTYGKYYPNDGGAYFLVWHCDEPLGVVKIKPDYGDWRVKGWSKLVRSQCRVHHSNLHLELTYLTQAEYETHLEFKTFRKLRIGYEKNENRMLLCLVAICISAALFWPWVI